MNLKELNLKKSYDSDENDILNDFYIPALSNSVVYKRLAGFFSSSSLAIAAKGLSNFIINGGKMKLITSAKLQKADMDAIQNAHKNPEKIIEKIFLDDLNSIENEFVKDHISALGWMIANGKLEIKIAIINKNINDKEEMIRRGMFHQKVGILEDCDGNKLSFSGSDNESANSWQYNIEEFKVFHDWVKSEKSYFDTDDKRFDKFWSGESIRMKLINAPEAIKKKLIEIAPEDIEKINLEKYYKKAEKIESTVENKIQKKDILFEKKEKKNLYPFQLDAVNAWLDNKKIGILEMATGTGKTIVALGAVENISKEKKNICVTLVVPYKHLTSQWIKDIEIQLPDAVIVEAHSGAHRWKHKLSRLLTDYGDGFIKQLFIVTLYSTFSSKNFIDLIKSKINKNNEYMVIADEMHNLGAPKYSLGMVNEFGLRLGLSATPVRHFDELGTQALIKYFDKVVYDYPLGKAIKDGFLVHYDYHPNFIRMTNREFAEYLELSKKIINNLHRGINDEEKNDYLKRLLIIRSKILKNSNNKLNAFRILIKKLKEEEKINHLLVYCDSGGQLKKAQEIINEINIISHKFTEKESMSERQSILDKFDKGLFDCLVAIKCLDEGVNVPSTKTAIILASSTNPREYIQRRGRVLRKNPGKDKANIYDFIVLPPDNILDEKLKDIEQTIIKKEINRVQDFLETADNKSLIINHLSDIMIKYNVYLD